MPPLHFQHARTDSTILSPHSVARSAGASYGLRTKHSHPAVIRQKPNASSLPSTPLLYLFRWTFCFIPIYQTYTVFSVSLPWKVQLPSELHFSLSESSLNKTARKNTEVITKQSRHSHRPGICNLLATKHQSCNYCYEQLVRVREH